MVHTRNAPPLEAEAVDATILHVADALVLAAVHKTYHGMVTQPNLISVLKKMVKMQL